MNLEHAAALTPCLVVLVLPGWSLWRMVKSLRAGDRRRPAWFGHATWASFFLMVLAWLWGLAAGPALQSLEENARFGITSPTTTPTTRPTATTTTASSP